MNNPEYVKPWLACNSMRHLLGETGSRSSKTTDVLNEEVIQIFKSVLAPEEGWHFKTEKRIPCARGKTFTVDVLAYRDGEFKAAILLKAIQKSYNKNRQNYANTLEGEVGRIKDLPMHEGVSVITIDWVPKTVPNGQKMEVTKIPDTSRAEKRWNSYLEDGSFVSFCKIRFDLSGQMAYNIEGTEKLREAIERLKIA